MPNRYGGVCYKCGNWCAPGDGVFEKVSRPQREKWPNLPRSIRWQVQHHDCARDYDRFTHHIQNPRPPLVTDARYQPAALEGS